jgi:hypothetical protein
MRNKFLVCALYVFALFIGVQQMYKIAIIKIDSSYAIAVVSDIKKNSLLSHSSSPDYSIKYRFRANTHKSDNLYVESDWLPIDGLKKGDNIKVAYSSKRPEINMTVDKMSLSLKIFFIAVFAHIIFFFLFYLKIFRF